MDTANDTATCNHGATSREADATPCIDYKLCLNYHESALRLALDRSRPDVVLRFQHIPAMSPVHWARNYLVQDALNGPCTHLFLIDADIGFEPEDVFAFLDADLDIVGSKTASGGASDSGRLTAAHRSLPFGSEVRVTNLRNGRSVIVRINDRGHFIRGRIVDVTPAAAHALGFSGLAPVSLERVSG